MIDCQFIIRWRFENIDIFIQKKEKKKHQKTIENIRILIDLSWNDDFIIKFEYFSNKVMPNIRYITE